MSGRRWEVLHADALAAMRGFPDAHFDALVCDPPAGISFMNKQFDHDRGGRQQWVAWLAEIMAEALRVTVPGGHAFVWALPRTAHWTATAMEDAGWLIRDVVVHLTGQGFPKSKSLLKPAAEHWILARKPGPLRELGIDACRVGTDDIQSSGWTGMDARRHAHGTRPRDYSAGKEPTPSIHTGRWPSNVLLSHNAPTATSPGCRLVGTRRVKGSGWETAPANHALPPSGYHGWDERQPRQGYADADGTEVVDAWECEQPHTERRPIITYAGTRLDVTVATEAALTAFLGLLTSGLRANSHSADTSGVVHGYDRARVGLGLQDFQGGCLPCRRFGDELTRQVQEAGRVSALQLADALESARDQICSRLHSQDCPPAGRPSSSDDVHEQTSHPCTPSNRTVAADHAPFFEQASASHTPGTQLPGLRHSEPHGNSPESNTSALDASAPPKSSHTDCTVALFRRLVSIAGDLSFSSSYLPLSLSVDELYHAGCAVAALDAQAGERRSAGHYPSASTGTGNGVTYMPTKRQGQLYADHGSASRFFPTFGPDPADDDPGSADASAGDDGGVTRMRYVPKASRAEREAGLEGLALYGVADAAVYTDLDLTSGDRNRENARAGANRNGPLRAANFHPTVKSLELMRWLVRLVSKPGDLVLDPFAGSGSTGAACVLENRRCVLVEADAAYADLARRRLIYWSGQDGPLFRTSQEDE